MPIVISVVVAVAIGVAVLVGTAQSRFVRAVRTDIHDGLWAGSRWIPIATASVIVVVGHATTFLIAARTAGTDASLGQLLPLAMLVLLAMSVPTNIGGWGPREGVAAWVFGAAGLGAAQGVTAATTYGVLVFVASLPGAVVLVIARRHRGTVSAPDATESGRRPVGAAQWLTVRTRCSVAACPSTVTSTPPRVQRLRLSNDEDFDRVDAVRATSDAILVGAATVRNDNPRLLVDHRSGARHAWRGAVASPRSR